LQYSFESTVLKWISDCKTSLICHFLQNQAQNILPLWKTVTDDFKWMAISYLIYSAFKYWKHTISQILF
jgi:hypothetical protein